MSAHKVRPNRVGCCSCACGQVAMVRSYGLLLGKAAVARGEKSGRHDGRWERFLPYRAQLLLNGLLFIVSLGFSQPVCASAPTVHYTSDSRCAPPWVAQTTASPQGSSPINASVGWRDGAGGGRILVRHTTRRQAPTGSSDVGPTLLGTKKSKVGHGRSGQHMERLWTDEMN